MKINFDLLKIGILMLSALGAQAQPSIGGYNVYYGNLHNHSNVSDGTGTPDAAYNYAKNTGQLDFFSLSDHSGAIDATEWQAIKTAADRYNLDNVFTAFYGFEWTENVLGHVTVINPPNYITTASPNNTFAGFCNWLNANECVAFFNHPGRNNSTGHEFEHFTTTPTDKIVGMELWNKTDRFPAYYYTDGYYANDGNLSWFDEAISRGWKVGAAGGEDNHSGNWGTATTSKLAVLANAKTRTDIYNALKAKRFFTTYDKNLALSFKIGGYEMGSNISASSTSVAITGSDADGEIFTRVELLKNGSVFQTWTPGSSTLNITGDLTCSTGEYYYVRVKQSDGDEAISSPIWCGQVNQLPVVNITSPTQNTSFVAPASITITVLANDPDGTIQKVEFYQGSTKIGESVSSPYSFVWTNATAGSYSLTAKAFDNLGGTKISASVPIFVVNPGDPITVSSKIATGMDDVEESNVGNISANVNSTDIELVYDASTSAGTQVVGLRFLNMNIPKNAVISNAYIQFSCDEISTAACNLTISGEDIDNSPAFSPANYNVSSRIKTTAQVNWVPAGWAIAGEAGANQRTPNLSAIIQEITERTGYLQTSALSFIITGTGARIAHSYNGSPAQAAVLFVTYTVPAVNQPPVVSITSPQNNATFTAPASITISANAADADGSIVKVEFYNGSTLLGTDNSAPYSFTWNGVNEGSYLLKALATDNLGATKTSTIVSVMVNPALVVISNVQAVNVTETGATITWTTNLNSSSDVEYGTTTSYGSNANVAGNVTSHSVPLTGLAAGTLYHYRVKSNGAYSVDYTFTTQTPVVTNLYSPGSAVIAAGSSTGILNNLATSNNSYYVLNSSKAKPYISDWYGVVSIQNVSGILRFTVKYEGKYSRSVNQILYLRNFNSNSWIQIDARTVSTTDIPISFVQNNPANFISSGGEVWVRVYATTSGKSFTCSGDFMQIIVERQAASQLAEKSGQIKPLEISEVREDKFVLYPNPVFDLLNIELQGIEKNELISVEILNIAGNEMRSYNFSGVKTQLNLVDLPSGIYFVKVKTSENMYLRKIIMN